MHFGSPPPGASVPAPLLTRVVKVRDGVAAIVGTSDAMLAVKTLLAKYARSPSSTVLVTGESGTGKDLAARAIHAESARRRGPFLNITCSALPESLLESELFGHERGAFTDAVRQKPGLLEQAHGGTLFLDEIAEMQPALQAKLLRFLEERAFRRVGGTQELRPDVRVVAATHRDLRAAVASGAFREDLFYRLSVLHAVMPPLRARDGDLEPLLDFFVERFDQEFGKNVRGVTEAGLELLRCHRWPGNVRELRNVLERAVLLAEGPVLERTDLDGLHVPSEPPAFELPSEGVDLEALERSLLVQALDRTGGNQTQAGRLLGLNRDQVRYRVDKWGLRTDDRRR